MTELPAPRLVSLLGRWRGNGAAHDRLAATLRALVLDGHVALEARLPAERTLAAALGVSRSTVTAAYNRLRAEGYLVSRQGSGSFAALPRGHAEAPDAIVPGDGIDLRIAALPAPPLLHELAHAALDDLPRWQDHHGYEPLGLPSLREAIAARFERRGLPTRPEQIAVTNGALDALDLTVRALLPRGRRALVEIPSYPGALDVFRGARARLRTLPVGDDGWDLDALGGDPVDLAYLVPDFQNPTGTLVDDDSRRRAVRMLERAGTRVVIDETFAELGLDEVATPAPAALYGSRTITIGSLDKIVWGGLRIGWVRAEPAIVHRIAAVRAMTALASPVFEQLLAVHVFDRLDEILAGRRTLVRRRRDALAAALAEELGEWRYRLPAGGLFLWCELPHATSTSLVVAARAHGLYLTPGPRFGSAGLLERFLRLPFTLPPEQLARAVSILAGLSSGARGAGAVRLNADYTA